MLYFLFTANVYIPSFAAESNSTNSKSHTSDVHMVNIDLIDDENIHIIKEASQPVPPITNLNFQKVRVWVIVKSYK